MTVQALAAVSLADQTGFANLIRERTQAVHREAERSGYIADLLRGRATREGYAIYLVNLLPAYEAMEAHLGKSDAPPSLKAFSVPGLARAASLRHDIAAIIGDSFEVNSAVLPEAWDYATAVECAAQGDGIALVSHAYARYLGDLSGGQILKPLLARSLGLEHNALTFYDFPDVPDIGACKADLRRGLDTIGVDSADAERVLAEAITAFRHTIAVSTAVSVAQTKTN